MNLVISEILLKQSGDSSLDRARMEHRHHGLIANINGRFDPNMDLESSSKRLRAEPMTWDSGERRGTFELWHQTSRELPILGEWESRPHQQKGYRIVLNAGDKRLPLVPRSGLSLWDCLINLPTLFTHLAAENISPNYTRASCKRVDLDDGYELYVVLHPNTDEKLESVYEQIKIDPQMFERFSVTELQSGCIITVRSYPNTPPLCFFPVASCQSPTETFFSTSDAPLNEFGFIYFAFFILGNYARYYPDIWIRDIESSAPLSLAVEALVEGFNQRVPLLALSEMQREL